MRPSPLPNWWSTRTRISLQWTLWWVNFRPIFTWLIVFVGVQDVLCGCLEDECDAKKTWWLVTRAGCFELDSGAWNLLPWERISRRKTSTRTDKRQTAPCSKTASRRWINVKCASCDVKRMGDVCVVRVRMVPLRSSRTRFNYLCISVFLMYSSLPYIMNKTFVSLSGSGLTYN